MEKLKNKWITILIAPLIFASGIGAVNTDNSIYWFLFVALGILGCFNSFFRIGLRDLTIKK